MIVTALEQLAYAARAVSRAAWRLADELALAPVRERVAIYALLGSMLAFFWSLARMVLDLVATWRQ